LYGLPGMKPTVVAKANFVITLYLPEFSSGGLALFLLVSAAF